MGKRNSSPIKILSNPHREHNNTSPNKHMNKNNSKYLMNHLSFSSKDINIAESFPDNIDQSSSISLK